MSLLRKWGNPTYTNNEGAGGGQTVGGKFDWTPLGAPSPTIPKLQAPKGSLSMFQSSADDKDWDRPRRIRAVKQAMARKREAAMFAAQRNLSRGMYRGGSRYGGSAGFGSFGRRYQGFGKLAKFDPGQARDAQGRWTSGAGAKAIPGAPKLASNRRLWGQYRPDADDPEWKDIEGIDVPEGRVFRHRKVVPRISKVLGPEKTTELARWAGKATKALEKDIVAYGMRAPHMVGKGAEERDVRAAFQHGRVLAMHDVGLVDYWFRFNPENIDTFHRMTPFIRYARRACGAVLRDGRPEEFAQLRREFGTSSEPKKYHRFDTRGAKKGEEKKHFFIHNEVVKGEGAGALAKREAGTPLSEAELQQRRDAANSRKGNRVLAGASMGAAAGIAGGLAMVANMRRGGRIPSNVSQRALTLVSGLGGVGAGVAAGTTAMAALNAVGTDEDGKVRPGVWATLGALGGLALGARSAGKLNAASHKSRTSVNSQSQRDGFRIDRGATTILPWQMKLSDLRYVPAHLKDIATGATAVGSKPTGKQIRRQFLRDSLMQRERVIATDHEGRVVANIKGDHHSVSIRGKPREAIYDVAREGKGGRMMHNHPVDTVPSPGDVSMHGRLVDASAGRRAPTSLVYSHGRTAEGKVRHRVTRYDHGVEMPGAGFPRMNLSEADWKAAARPRAVTVVHKPGMVGRAFGDKSRVETRMVPPRSRYRTKAVEKLAKAVEKLAPA